MSNLFIFFTALVVSVAIIPVMIRLAPRLGMVDIPDPRKVHTIPTPRVGGVGIVIGSLIPVLLWVQLDNGIIAYLFGALILLVFGLWDDSRELGHYVKFIGQFIAVVAVVYYGDIYVKTLPFADLEPISASIGKPFTVFAIVGMINAINHSDGLDGLAGGLSVLSLSCIAYLASLTDDGYQIIAIAIATVGGVLGFLRYNTHPAGVFMGDGGSQFLGFTLGVLAVMLTQTANTALSPALPALLLGLPIIDILAVFAQRAYQRMNWFRATKNHIHHRLLELGFEHYETVVIIYSIQMLFVVSAIILRYETDSLIISLYLLACVLIFVFLIAAKSAGWQVHKTRMSPGLLNIFQSLMRNTVVRTVPLRLLSLAVPTLLIFFGIFITQVPRDFSIAAAILSVTSLLSLLFASRTDSILFRANAYIAAAFIVYLQSQQTAIEPALKIAEIFYYVVLATTIGLAARFATDIKFKINPLDYLLIFMVISVGVFSRNHVEHADFGAIVAKLVILFYGCELIIAHMKSRWHYLNIGTLVTLVMLASKDMLFP